MAETYAIVESGGKQYRAEKGAELVVDRLPADEGAKVNLRAVMFRGDGDVVLDGGELDKVKVEAKVAAHLRGKKLRIFKYKPKKGYRRRAGHRSELTRLEVTEVKMLSRKPAAKPKAAEEDGAEKKAEKKAAPKKAGETKKTGQAKKAGEAKKAGGQKKSSGGSKQGKAKQGSSKSSSTSKTAAKKDEG